MTTAGSNTSAPSEQIRSARITGKLSVLGALLAALVALLGTVGTVAWQEFAKERQGCTVAPSREACDQKYAGVTGCEDDAVSVPGGITRRALPGGKIVVELLWSRTCQTLWARGKPENGVFYFKPWIEPDRKDATRFFAAGERSRGWLESPMAFSPDGDVAARACAAVQGRDGFDWTCTGMLMPDGTDVTEGQASVGTF